MADVDLFGSKIRVKVIRNQGAYAGTPGRGPADQTCGNCDYFLSIEPNNRRYFKCDRVEWTHGAATDIRKNMPACELFEPTE